MDKCCDCEGRCYDDCPCDDKCDFIDCSSCANREFDKDITHARMHGYTYDKKFNQFYFADLKMAQEVVLEKLKSCKDWSCGFEGEM